MCSPDATEGQTLLLPFRSPATGGPRALWALGLELGLRKVLRPLGPGVSSRISRGPRVSRGSGGLLGGVFYVFFGILGP